MRYSRLPVCVSALTLLLVMTACPRFATADILELTDGNLIECKLVRKGKGPQGEYVIRDEHGKEKKYPARRVKSFIPTKSTSWEVKAERKEWYTAQLKKVKNSWKSHERFARKCYKKHLQDEASQHYSRAYELRKAKTGTSEKELLDLAKWLDDCELYDEATEERRVVYGMRKERVDDTVNAHSDLAKWCTRFELLAEAAEQYESALKLNPDSERLQKALVKVSRQLAIPMDNGFYRAARIRVAAAARYIQSNQDGDGGIGSDITEAGVHGKRGMTSLATMALLADWDFGVLAGKYEADEVPAEISRALDYLEGFEPSNHPNLRGDDVWGPIFALDLLVQCYRRPQFGERKSRLKAEIERLIEDVVELQRSDGGWFYYNFVNRSASFVTASALVSLIHASNSGFKVPRQVIVRGAEQIEALRQGHGTFTYSTGLTQGPVGACARSPVCELALKIAGAGKPASLRYAVEIFFKNRHILERLKGRAGTHIGQGKTAPYYLLFAHYWTARAIKHLDRKVQRAYLNGLGGGLVAYQESDATFGDWTGTRDYKIYGTAFAALTLYHIASLNATVEDLKETPASEDEDDAEEKGEGESEDEEKKKDAGKEGEDKKGAGQDDD